MLRSTSIALLGVVVVGAAATSARAGGFAVAHFGGEQGNAASGHPTSIYFNPAGLALGSGWRLYGEGLFALRHTTYNRHEGAIDHVVRPGDSAAGTPVDAVSANAGTASLTNLVPAPFLGAVTDFGVPNFGAGIALYVPFGGQDSWNKNSDYAGSAAYPGAADGVQRWSEIEGELREIYLTLGAAYRLPGPRLSFGVGLNLIQGSIKTIRARTASGTDDLVGPGGNILEGRSLIDTTGYHLGAGIGVIWQPLDSLWLGLSYQSQPNFGTETLSGTLTNKFGAGNTDKVDLDLEQSLPDITRLAVRYQVMPRLELLLQGEYQRWSVFKGQCLLNGGMSHSCALADNGSALPQASHIIVNIPRHWKDTFTVRAGGRYQLMHCVWLEAALDFDSNAVPDKYIDVSLYDSNKVLGLAGVTWVAVPDHLLLNVTLNDAYYISRTVAPRARDAMGEPIADQQPSRVPDQAGTYKQNILFANLGAEYHF